MWCRCVLNYFSKKTELPPPICEKDLLHDTAFFINDEPFFKVIPTLTYDVDFSSKSKFITFLTYLISTIGSSDIKQSFKQESEAMLCILDQLIRNSMYNLLSVNSLHIIVIRCADASSVVINNLKHGNKRMMYFDTGYVSRMMKE